MNLLFGFSGRIGRGGWWLGQLAIFVVGAVFVGIFAGIAGTYHLAENAAADGLETLNTSIIAALLAMTALITWINLATTVKRFHDRDKSGVWFLISFVPLIGPIWIIVECGILPGSPGMNDYGLSSGPGGYDASAGLDIAATYSSPERQQVAAAVPTRRAAAAQQSRPKPSGPPKFGRRGV